MAESECHPILKGMSVYKSNGQNRHRLWAASLVLLAWALVVAAVFWHYQLRFQNQWFTFNGRLLSENAEMPKTDKFSVVHFVDESCPCSRFSAPHIEDVESRSDKTRVSFASVYRDVTTDSAVLARLVEQVPASPSVAVWDRDGELRYFGPYSAGAICGQGDDMLERVLTPGVSGVWLSQEAVGCFCPWPNSQHGERS
jgi:hypothetical protein